MQLLHTPAARSMRSTAIVFKILIEQIPLYAEIAELPYGPGTPGREFKWEQGKVYSQLELLERLIQDGTLNASVRDSYIYKLDPKSQQYFSDNAIVITTAAYGEKAAEGNGSRVVKLVHLHTTQAAN